MENENLRYARALLRTLRHHAAEALGFRVRPRQLRFAVTKRCHARCMMCNAWRAADPPINEIRPGEIRILAQRNRRFLARVAHVAITGGEPTLRHDLVELVRVVTEWFPGASLGLDTNGFDTACVLATVAGILRVRPQLTVMVSLDGLGKSHNAIRGVQDVFPAVVETIDRLIALSERGAKLRVAIRFVLTNRNGDQMLAVFHFCRERALAFHPVYPVHGQLYENADAEIGLARHAVRQFLDALARIRLIDPSLALRELEHQLRGFPRDFDCWAGCTTFLIEPDGRVFPNDGCPPTFCLGGLRDVDYRFALLLRSPRARQVQRWTRRCRLCRLPSESLATLEGAEALAGYRKRHSRDAYPTTDVQPETQKAEPSPHPRTR